MHILGLEGMPRRTYRYPKGLGFEFWNFISTVGAMTIAVSILVFLLHPWRRRRRGSDPGWGRAAGGRPRRPADPSAVTVVLSAAGCIRDVPGRARPRVRARRPDPTR